MRTTHTLVQVAMALLDGDDSRHWGYEITKRAGTTSGAIYPMLTRMIEQGWVTDGRESLEESALRGRPPRRYFEVTEQGKREMAELLRNALDDRRFFCFQDQLHTILASVEASRA